MKWGWSVLLGMALIHCHEPPKAPPLGVERTARPRASVRVQQLRLAVGPMMSPMVTYDAYEPLFAGLSRELGRPHRFIQRRTYEELNELIVAGEVDLAFVAAGAFAALPRDAAIDLLAVPIRKGKPTYHAAIVVHADRPIENLADLRGKKVAFTDRLSYAGYVYPLYRLRQIGATPSTYFGSTMFSGSYDRSITAVQRGLVDAASVLDASIGPPVSWPALKLRVIEISPDFAPPPVVAPRSVPGELRARLQRYLLDRHRSKAGRQQLGVLGIDGFVRPEGISYQPLREMLEVVTATSD